MNMQIKKNLTFDLECTLLKGIVKDKQLKKFNYFYFEPDSSSLSSLMSNSWTILKIDALIADLQNIKSFLESQDVALKMTEDEAKENS